MSRMSIDHDELRKRQGAKGMGKRAAGPQVQVGVYGSVPPNANIQAAPPTSAPSDRPAQTSTLADRPQRPSLETSSIGPSDQDRRNRLVDIERRQTTLRNTPNAEYRANPSLAGEARGLRYEGQDLRSSLREPGPVQDPGMVAANRANLNDQAVAILQRKAMEAANATGPRSIQQIEDRGYQMLRPDQRPIDRPINQPGNITPGELAYERGQAVRNYGAMDRAIGEESQRRNATDAAFVDAGSRLDRVSKEGIPFAPYDPAVAEDSRARLLAKRDDARARTDPALTERIRQREFAPELAEAVRGETLAGVGRTGRMDEANIRGVEAGVTEAESRAKLLEAQTASELAKNKRVQDYEQSAIPPEVAAKMAQATNDAYSLVFGAPEAVDAFKTELRNAAIEVIDSQSLGQPLRVGETAANALENVLIPKIEEVARYDSREAAKLARDTIAQLSLKGEPGMATMGSHIVRGLANAVGAGPAYRPIEASLMSRVSSRVPPIIERLKKIAGAE